MKATVGKRNGRLWMVSYDLRDGKLRKAGSESLLVCAATARIAKAKASEWLNEMYGEGNTVGTAEFFGTIDVF